jgi:hypothetical protein
MPPCPAGGSSVAWRMALPCGRPGGGSKLNGWGGGTDSGSYPLSISPGERGPRACAVAAPAPRSSVGGPRRPHRSSSEELPCLQIEADPCSRQRGSAARLAHGLHSSSARRRRRARRAGTRACPQAAASCFCRTEGTRASPSPWPYCQLSSCGRRRSLQAALPLRSLLYSHQPVEEHQNMLCLSLPFPLI